MEEARRVDETAPWHRARTTDAPDVRPTRPTPDGDARRAVDGTARCETADDVAGALGLCVAEILTGAREVDSIARWITDDVHRHLQHRAALAARARSLGRHARARPLLRVGSVLVCHVTEGVAEATVVVLTRNRARAVALRLEDRQGRWRATAVGVL